MRIVIRADASQRIGTGHVMRCLAIADELSKYGATVQFICRKYDGHLCQYINDLGYPVSTLELSQDDAASEPANGTRARPDAGWENDASEAIAAVRASEARPNWLIVDHYALGAEWERAVGTCADRLMVIDDVADRQHDCNLLLDQNYYENQDRRYAGLVPEHCRLLLGPKFALLRDEFRRAKKKVVPRTDSVQRLLVFFGGIDAGNHTVTALTAIVALGRPELSVDVVIGNSHRKKSEIEDICRENEFTLHVQTNDLAELMRIADASIGAGGSVTWERCCLGLPSMVFAVADNQRQLVCDAGRAGILSAPRANPDDVNELTEAIQCFLDDHEGRRSISAAGMSLVDGYGVHRVRQAMGLFAVKIREAAREDCASIFEWRNDPEVRAASSSSAAIDWTEHCKWFEQVLESPDRSLLVGEASGRPVGVVRFDTMNSGAEVSIFLVTGFSGKGLGMELLLAAERWLESNKQGITCIRAVVKNTNVRSTRLFSDAGYRPKGEFFEKRFN